MAEHAHAYLPPIEPGAQRPLWALVIVAAVIIAGGLLTTWPGRWDGDPIGYQALVEAAGLFEEGLTGAALSQLDSRVLQRSAEASLLRGVIAIYDPDSEAEEAQRWLEQAAEAGAPGADTLFGFLLLQKGCTSCAKKAAHWFEHALARRADRNARLGLAVALTQQRYALRGSLNEGQDTAAAFTEEAANQGFAYAQYRLATRYLPYGHQAQLWLAMAALQGDHDAVGRLGISPDPSIMREAEQHLLAIARSDDRAWESRDMVRRAVQSRRISREDLSRMSTDDSNASRSKSNIRVHPLLIRVHPCSHQAPTAFAMISWRFDWRGNEPSPRALAGETRPPA